jgi:hypothetical protein
MKIPDSLSDCVHIFFLGGGMGGDMATG